ncbi:hypothetical protein JZ751_025127 [Albula glossodonta]|uniref:Thromboxane A2 receptor n=1 Tax=Albula glossodonta TaxID=121402 RepID=A0A8T2PHP0_9TELE|nr:hypothetical protein JZ751_025127 [Albula glossodonta]
MNSSSSTNNKITPTCFSINSPPFNYTHTIASAYFSAVFSGLGLSSNLFALVVLIKAYQRTQNRSRSSFLIFLSGLVVTDFMGLLVTGSIVVSFHITHFNWRQLDPYCHFCNFMGMSMVFYGLCPLLLGAAMAVERFVGINRPFARSANMSKTRAWSMVGMVWILAGCISLLPLMGLGSYHMQMPGSWCFFNISSQPLDLAFSLIFSLVGLLSLMISFVLNTISVVTLLKVCCGQEATSRRRDHEVEMMVQLIWIMIIASICWCPLLVILLSEHGSVLGCDKTLQERVISGCGRARKSSHYCCSGPHLRTLSCAGTVTHTLPLVRSTTNPQPVLHQSAVVLYCWITSHREKALSPGPALHQSQFLHGKSGRSDLQSPASMAEVSLTESVCPHISHNPLMLRCSVMERGASCSTVQSLMHCCTPVLQLQQASADVTVTVPPPIDSLCLLFTVPVHTDKAWSTDLGSVFIAETVLSDSRLQIRYLLLWIRFATWNQILDPWVYILFRRAVLKRIYPRMEWSRGSIMSLYPSFTTSLRRLTRASLVSGVSKVDGDEAPAGEDMPTPHQPLPPTA